MNAIKFNECNRVLGKPQGMTDEECGSLPVYSDGVFCVSCWKMSFKERLIALLFGNVWVWVMSGNTQPPIAVDIADTVGIKEKMKDDYDKAIDKACKIMNTSGRGVNHEQKD